MSCQCQVKNPNPDEPCKICGDPRRDDLAGSKAREKMEAERIPTLLGMLAAGKSGGATR